MESFGGGKKKKKKRGEFDVLAAISLNGRFLSSFLVKRVIVNLFLHITCNKEAAEISPICITFAFTRSFLADCN